MDKNTHIIIYILIYSTLLCGCQYPFMLVNKETLKQDVLEKDPAFSSILDMKAEADTQIGSLRSTFEEKRISINTTIDGLKNELVAAKQGMEDKIRQIDEKLIPYRDELNARVKESIADLRLKESSLSAINSTILKLTKLIEQGSSQDLKDKSAEWQEKVSSLKAEAQQLDTEISLLRQDIRLMRMKLRLIS